jgi:hypothetical protein
VAPRRHLRSGQALLGVLIAVALLSGLAASLSGAAFEASQAAQVSSGQIAAMSLGEGGLNTVLKILIDTTNGTFTANLANVIDSAPPVWVSQASSPAGTANAFDTMMAGYGPFQHGPFPNVAQSGTVSEAAWIAAWGTAPGPGGTYTWLAQAGITTVPSPAPTWQDTGQVRTLTWPIGLLAYAWVWDPTGAALGEVTTYSPPAAPGDIILTYQDCPPYFQVLACRYPTAVQVTIPPGQLMFNDPNAAIPPRP